MAGQLQDRIALITGGTTGIGFATAKRFLDEGAKVIITGRNAERAEVARQELGGRAEVIISDASNLNDIQNLFTQIKDTHGRLDVLFLNAGVAAFAPISELTPEEFDRQYNINVKGPLFALQAALPLLSKGSSVLFNTSAVQAKGFPGASIYAGTKAALRTVVRVAAAELAPLGLRVNAISPGPVETPIYGKLDMPQEAVDAFAQQVVSGVPLGRFGSSEEVANVALFLASDQSSYVHGAEITVDGGFAQV